MPAVFENTPPEDVELREIEPSMDYGARKYWTDVAEQAALMIKASAFLKRFEPAEAADEA